MKKLTIVFLIAFIFTMSSQEKLPYYQIPAAANEYTEGTVAGRMVDGLGFRYYWATEGLTEKDLSFRPTKEARTTLETINHILGLSEVILNATLQIPNGTTTSKMSFTEKRKKTLENLQQASLILRKSKHIEEFKMIFGEKVFPFWNVINGPIADALWHTGQVVSFRRSSGNPFPKGVSVLTGKKKN